MGRTKYGAVLLITWLLPYCHAQILVKDYLSQKNKYIREAQKMYVIGVAHGFSSANADLTGRGLPPLFCVPPKLPLGGDTYIHILDLQIKQMREWKEWPEIQQWPVALVLLKALQQTFVCQSPTPGR
ncbi:MAG: hypothetical protein JST11_17070 [Acidobacteria bacterium]|nr:hypothetical protein [Acidobacteriota bacterium]